MHGLVIVLPALLLFALLGPRSPHECWSESDGVWTNWDGEIRVRPSNGYIQPESEPEIVEIVLNATKHDSRVKVVGAGHSFSAITAVSASLAKPKPAGEGGEGEEAPKKDTLLVNLDRYAAVLNVDREAATVTVQAGIRIHALISALEAEGLALVNMGAIDQQSLAGAISTGTHGTGLHTGSMSSQVLAMRLITAAGEILELSAEKEPDVFAAAKVGLGALGVISTISLQCRPAFRIEKELQPVSVSDFVVRVPSLLADKTTSFDYTTMPNTNVGLLATYKETTQKADPSPSWIANWFENVFKTRLSDAAIHFIGESWWPSLTPFVINNVVVPTFGHTSKKVQNSHEAMTVDYDPTDMLYSEMEVFVPVSTLEESLPVVTSFFDIHPEFVMNQPSFWRYVKADDAWLSPCPEDCAVFSFTLRRKPYLMKEFCAEFLKAMAPFAGRPHWGKIHNYTVTELAPLYPRWKDFLAVRARVDPNGMFLNRHLAELFGIEE